MSHVALGKYQLIAELGRGGMADVFLAVSQGPAGLGFSKLVVIKRLRRHLASDPDFVSMLVDEARIAARLNHPNVVQTVEIGEANGEYFLAMEYLEGQPLRRIIQKAPKRGGFPAAMHYFVLHDALAGLHHAHELADFNGQPLNVVHRDVSPHNIFVTYDGQTKIMDFGIAKAVGRSSETRHGVVKGKAPYMAPEQVRGEEIDRRSDVFALGILLWEAATGRRYWENTSEPMILRSLVRHQLPPSPRTVDSSVPEEIDAMCCKALAPEASGRYASAAELEQDLRRYLEASGQRVTNRQIGKHVSEMFREEREKLSRIVEQQLAALPTSAAPQSGPMGGGRYTNEDATKTTVASPAFEPEEVVHVSESPAGLSSTLQVPQAPPPARLADPAEQSASVNTASAAGAKRRTGVIVAAAAAAVVSLVVITMRVGGIHGQDTTTGAGSGAQGSRSPVSQMTLSLRASPANATFRIDDGPPLNNPYTSTIPKDGAMHVIRAEAAGYAPAIRNVVFDGDVSLQLFLSHAPAP